MPLIACRIELPATELAFHATICTVQTNAWHFLQSEQPTALALIMPSSFNNYIIHAIIYNPRAWKRIPCWDILRKASQRIVVQCLQFEDFEARPPGPGLRTRAPSPPPLRKPGTLWASLSWRLWLNVAHHIHSVFAAGAPHRTSYEMLWGYCLSLLPLSIAHLWLGLPVSSSHLFGSGSVRSVVHGRCSNDIPFAPATAQANAWRPSSKGHGLKLVDGCKFLSTVHRTWEGGKQHIKSQHSRLASNAEAECKSNLARDD